MRTEGLPEGAPPRVWTLLRRGGVEERGPATRLGLLARVRTLSGPLRLAFAAARLVFADVFAVVREDRRHNYGEDRFILLGMVEERLLAVAYAIRGERTRIISARLAEPRERRRYHEETR